MKIIKGKTKPKGLRIVIYGPHGIGKTTLASKLPNALFLDYEGGTHGIEVTKADSESLPRSYATVKAAFEELKTAGYKYVVIDSADKLEDALDHSFCEGKPYETLFSVNDYGRTIAEHRNQMAAILDKATDLANAGVNIIWIAHEQSRKVETLEGSGSYDRHEMKLSKTVTPLFMEAADVVIFCAYKTYMVAPNKQAGETKAHVEGGARWCYTAHTNEWDAKHRASVNLPDDCSMDKMTSLLPKAIAAAITQDAQEPAPAPASVSAPVPEAQSPRPAPASDVSTHPLAGMLASYKIDEARFRDYIANHASIKSRYGNTAFAAAPYAEWPAQVVAWVERNIEKFAAKLK